jgi:addiction module HigA family antidote
MPRTPIHPGEHLADELKELGVTPNELARQIRVPVNRLTRLMKGQQAVTADTALRLGHWLGTGPQIWLNLQVIYDLRRAERALGTSIRTLPRHGESPRRRAA